MAAAAILGLAVLTGCGSDTGSVALHQVSGTAAVGAPIAGTVYVKDSQGTEVSVATDADGKFSIDVDGMQAPFMIKVVPNDNSDTLYSFASAEGIANATSLTNFALFLASDKANLAAIYDSWDGTGIDEIDLVAAQTKINANLVAEMESAGLDPYSYDFVKEPFDADSSGIDAVLDGIDVVVDVQMGGYTFQVVDNAAFVFDENIDAAGVYIGDPIDWPNGGEAAYPVVASMAIQGAAAAYTVFNDYPFIFGTPYLNGDQQEVSLSITLDESGVLTLTESNDTLVLTDPIIYKEQPNRIIWKDSASGSWVVGIVVPATASGPVIISFDVTNALHHDEAGFVTEGIFTFDVFPLQ